MIHVVYGYKTKFSQVWKSDSKTWEDTEYEKAFRFMQKVKHAPEMIIISWGADSRESYQYLKKGGF